MSKIMPPYTSIVHHVHTLLAVISPIILSSAPPMVPSASGSSGIYILNRPWCNFCDEYHEDKTCEAVKESKENIFGKKQVPNLNNSIVNSLDL